jgi:quinol monooxygenase YgiN
MKRGQKMSEVVELTIKVRPGHYAEVLKRYSEFAHNFMSEDPALKNVMLIGDEGRGIVRGIGVYSNKKQADIVNSKPVFANFIDSIHDLIEGAPERSALHLAHTWTRS